MFPASLTDDHRLVRDLLDETLLLRLPDVEVQAGHAGGAQVEQEHRQHARLHPDGHHLPAGTQERLSMRDTAMPRKPSLESGQSARGKRMLGVVVLTAVDVSYIYVIRSLLSHGVCSPLHETCLISIIYDYLSQYESLTQSVIIQDAE